MNAVTTSVCALFVGTGLAISVELLSLRERRLLQLAPLTARDRWIRVGAVIISTTLVMLSYRWASFDLKCLETAEVRPSEAGMYWRLAYHLTLFGLLIVATAIDFDCYTIPDEITAPGTLIGLVGACLIGEMQICHLWVDWSIAIPQLRGPLIPEWYDAHRFWHACSWSLAGIFAGASLTFLVRLVSSKVLGQEAMGFGDVTLMGMIGSFIGWQAVTLVFLLAPIAGLTIGVLIRILTGKTYLPYGPWLSAATLFVLFCWSHLWHQTRLIFSDWVSVALLGAVGGGGFVLLLVMLQLYKAIPTRSKSA